MSEQWEAALAKSKIVQSYADNFLGDQQEVSNALYASLAISGCFRDLDTNSQGEHIKILKAHLKDLKLWFEGCPDNYSPHYHLIQTEYHMIRDQFEKVMTQYEKAIRLAGKYGFAQIKALANERAGEYRMASGMEQQGRFYIEEAWQAYSEWGCRTKCKKLEQRYSEVIFPISAEGGHKELSESTTSTSNTSDLDLASVVKASQHIASQVKYDDLLNSLLQITIENAGAERGCLILQKDGQLCIEAIGVSGTDIIEILPSVPLSTMKIMPDSVINYCWRTKDSVVVNDAQADERFNNDPYIRDNELLSVLCLPVSAVGNSIGLLYLENSLLKGVFNKHRIELLQMLAGQIGISIDNANLISNLEEKVKERTREFELAYSNFKLAHEDLKSAQHQLTQQEKLASLGQLTAGIAHEIKNPLNFVTNFSDLSLELIEEIREELKGKPGELEDVYDILDDVQENLKKIFNHGTRADSIVKSMLQHSRGGTGKKEPANLNALIREFINLSFHGMRAAKDPIPVELSFELDDSIGDVPLIAQDFSRVLINLSNNAYDAMREKLNSNDQAPNSKEYKAKLIVQTSLENGRILLQIEDNGPEIPEEIKSKIMQPFFTTKKGTEGTGL